MRASLVIHMLQLIGIKSTESNGTLLHYLIHVCTTKFPEVLALSKELQISTVAVRCECFIIQTFIQCFYPFARACMYACADTRDYLLSQIWLCLYPVDAEGLSQQAQSLAVSLLVSALEDILIPPYGFIFIFIVLICQYFSQFNFS